MRSREAAAIPSEAVVGAADEVRESWVCCEAVRGFDLAARFAIEGLCFVGAGGDEEWKAERKRQAFVRHARAHNNLRASTCAAESRSLSCIGLSSLREEARKCAGAAQRVARCC